MERIIFKPKIRKMFNLKGICYIKLRGSIYFLKETKNESINYLRQFCNYEEKKPIEFYKIIHKDYLNKCEKVKKTEIKKKSYYAKKRILRAKEKIKKLKGEIKREEEYLKKIS